VQRRVYVSYADYRQHQASKLEHPPWHTKMPAEIEPYVLPSTTFVRGVGACF